MSLLLGPDVAGLSPLALGPCAALLRPVAVALAPCQGQAGCVARALNQLRVCVSPWPMVGARRLQFVPQAELPAGEAYEAFIHREAHVPTRDNGHDLFNGLVWCTQPALKARLNQLQAHAIQRDGVQARRGPLRDALTLMDENGALLEAPALLWATLLARDWQALFVTHRALWADARLTVVGHALLEQLHTAPRKPLTAHVLLPPVANEAPATAMRASQPLALDTAAWAAKPFVPLPILGVPGWWPANAELGFYDDPSVFRPPRPAGPAKHLAAQAGR